MVKFLLGFVTGTALCVVGSVANAAPITLKFAYEYSDRTAIFTDVVKPFVDAVNDEGGDAVKIEVYSGGTLGKGAERQPQLLLDGTADMSFVLTNALPAFSDNAALELPGMYDNLREVSMVYTRLVAAGALRGFDDFYAIAMLASEPKSIHSRRATASLDDLKGQKIRSSGPLEAAAFAKLGMEPVIMAPPAVAEAISNGAIDGAAVPAAVLQDLGIGRVTSSHYMLRASADTIAVLMSRKKFDSLPADVQAIIRRYSGERAVGVFADANNRMNGEMIGQLKSDPRRKVVFPTPSDVDRAQAAFKSVVNDWAAKDSRNQNLLQLVRAELAKLRATRSSEN